MKTWTEFSGKTRILPFRCFQTNSSTETFLTLSERNSVITKTSINHKKKNAIVNGLPTSPFGHTWLVYCGENVQPRRAKQSARLNVEHIHSKLTRIWKQSTGENAAVCCHAASVAAPVTQQWRCVSGPLRSCQADLLLHSCVRDIYR